MASRGVHAMPLAVLHSPVVSPAARGGGGLGFGGASPAAARDADASQQQQPPLPRHRRRDHEASRMTAFPTPGFAATGGPIAPAPRTTGSVATKPAGRASLDAPRSASMYWMPDHLCKTCYDCGASFSLFRRRHHCRLCGQIFCHACSSQFVDGTPHGFRMQMIRICKFCSRYVTADAEKRQRLPSAASAASRRSSVEDASPLLQQTAPPAATATAASGAAAADASVPVSSPLLFSPVNAAAAVPLPEGDSMERLSDEFDHEAHAMATADDEIPGRLPPVLFSIKSSESVELSPPAETPPEPVPVRTFRRPSLVRRRRSSLEFLNGNDQASTVATSASAELESAASSTEVPAETNADKPPPLDHETESFRVKTDLVTQREIVLDKYMTAAHERIREGIERSVDRSMKHFVGDGIEAKRLAASLEDMAFIVTGHLLFSMNFRGQNGFNFAGLVKVKSIATPSGPLSPHKDPYSFKWLAGCVCRKQLSHKQMARKIDNPRILLLACAISYDRSAGTGKLSSLDALIESEKSYMEILVDKISRLEPDIVFVERTVSRHAQEQLRERGIAIVLNVKRETLDRIARYTGAAVLPSVDHVDQVRPDDVVGRCRSFYAQTVPVAVDDVPTTGPTATATATGAATATATANGNASAVAPTSEGSATNGSANGNGVQRSASTRARTETYLYLDGCDPLNGCTVLITGPSKMKLKRLKALMWSVLSMTYRTLLEAHMLSGLGLGFSDWYRRSLADQQERAAWCTTCTLRQYETVEGQLRYYQCSGYKQIGITPYAKEDISLGNFLAKEMEALSYRCHNPKCNYTMVDHVQTFSCTVGTVTVSFEELPDSDDASAAEGEGPDGSYFNVLSLLDKGQASGSPSKVSMSGSLDGNDEQDCPVITYGKWCSECSALISPFAPLKKYAYKFSLARMLEILLSDGYPHPPVPEQVDTSPVTSTGCTHDFMKSHVLFFNVGRIVARMDFAPRKPVRLFNTPTFVVVNGTRRCRSLAPGMPSSQGKESASSDMISLAASRRLTALATLLEKLVELFMERIHSIEEVVMTCEDEDGVATAVLIEVALAKKMVEEKQAAFADRLAEIEQLASSQERLMRTDHAKHVLYYIVCMWIEEMQKLRKTIRSSLAVEPEGSVAASSSFSLTGFSFSTPTTQSPVMSPRNGRLSSPRRSRPGSKSVTSYSVDERSRASSAALSFNSVSETNDLITSDIVSSPKVVNKSLSTPAPSSQLSTSSTKSESKESGWKSMLWDIYRAVGKSTPGDDFDLALPVELLDSHPSLTKPKDDGTVYLVSDTEPITFVAFALGSQSYEDQLPGWISAVQSKKAAPKSPPLSPEKAIELSNSASGSEWTRAALTTTMHVHFKHNAVETPRHLTLLYPSGSNTSGIWDFSVIAFFPLQFEALRELFYGSREDFLFSISHVNDWAALGGKSGASFYRTLDNRFVVKHISSTEQQSFLDVLPSYFEYMSKVFHEEIPTVISKIVGMYQTTITKKDTGQRTTHHVVVMENVFFGQEVSKTFDLKGSSRNRYVKPGADGKPRAVELDGNFVEMTEGHPMGVIAEDHELLMSAIKNDAAFLTSINIVDFSLVLGLGGATTDMPNAYTHMTVGIIDYMRQFDLMKRVESVSKSVAMIAGQSSPTIIEPALYSKRFSDAIKRYFMPVTPIDSNRNDPYIPPSR